MTSLLSGGNCPLLPDLDAMDGVVVVFVNFLILLVTTFLGGRWNHGQMHGMTNDPRLVKEGLTTHNLSQPPGGRVKLALCAIPVLWMQSSFASALQFRFVPTCVHTIILNNLS